MGAANVLSPNQVYLSREGVVSGPYSSEDLERFRRNGELMKYAWIWDGASDQWRPIHAQPPPPGPGPSTQPVPPQPPARPAPQAPQPNDRIVRAVCYDSQSLVGGVVEGIDSHGAWVLCASNFKDLGPFREGQKVHVNLVDESTGRSENAVAIVTKCRRDERGLIYQFEWQAAPGLLKL